MPTDDPKIRTDFPRPVREIENTWIPMPDGTRLAARIWLPEDAEADPVPAILEYLPYRKRDGTVARDHLTHPYFAGHGYASVRVDMRGTGDSEGVCRGEYLAQEQDDALAVIDWLTAQPWCSGKVGIMGISWGGFNGLQIAALRPKALGAVISLCSTDDRYADDIHFMGGAILGEKLSWGATAFAIANTPPDPAIVGDRWRALWQDRVAQNGLWLIDWFRHQRRDAFYAHGSVCEDYSAIEAPVYMIGGWADGYSNAVFRALEHLPGPKKGLIGPWGHKYPHFARPGPRIGFLQEALRWWDQHLKGIDTGIMDEPQLRVWMQDPASPAPYRDTRDGAWVAEPEWAGTARATQPLYPREGVLSAAPGAAPITLACPEDTGRASGAWFSYGLIADGPTDQAEDAGRMVTFDSEPLDDDMTLLGFPVFTAEVTSTTPQANLVATLSAVDTDGRATLLSYGVLNLTHRDSHAEPTPLPIGQPVPITLRLNGMGDRIAKGQRLRLGLSQAYWPVIWPSPERTSLTLAPSARIDLPLRAGRDDDAALAPFGPAEGAQPMATTVLRADSYSRHRVTDPNTGEAIHAATHDAGRVIHHHTGLTVDAVNHETFRIHPDDPTTAMGRERWTKRYERGDWFADLQTEITVRARRDMWEIRATLVARDADGIVAQRSWAEDIPRDLV